MINAFLIIFGKLISLLSKLFNLGSGSTWPGHIALTVNKNFIKDVLNKNRDLKIILIAGTNGKTTTAKLIKTILEKSGKRVFQNTAGANLLNGIASTLILNSGLSGKITKDFAIFEIDENTLPLILKELTPDYVILLNLFRDQLDRYGEVNTISQKWNEALKKLNDKTTLILNADDPQIANLGRCHISKAIPIPYRKRSYDRVFYFGLNDRNLANEKSQYAADSTYCPNCDSKLEYSLIFYSHLGIWGCPQCELNHPINVFAQSPFYPLLGIYNQYNTNAAVLLAKLSNVNNETIEQSLRNFKPAFGRQEILNINGKKVQIFLSKNPTSFNESLRTVTDLNAKNILLVLNDRIPDGRDVSWIWDVDFEEFIDKFKKVVVSGDRVFDLGLRLKYAELKNFRAEENLPDAIKIALKNTPSNETLYVLPTYSAMLEVRKILTGKKIL